MNLKLIIFLLNKVVCWNQTDQIRGCQSANHKQHTGGNRSPVKIILVLIDLFLMLLLVKVLPHKIILYKLLTSYLLVVILVIMLQ